MADIQDAQTPTDDDFNDDLIKDMMGFMWESFGPKHVATLAPLMVTAGVEVWINEVGAERVAAELRGYADRIEARTRVVN